MEEEATQPMDCVSARLESAQEVLQVQRMKGACMKKKWQNPSVLYICDQ